MTIKINGTNTTAQPSITGTDTDTGLVYGTDEVSIVTGGTDRVKVDSSGNVGIGTSSPIGFGPTLQVAGTDPAFIMQDTATAVDYFGTNITAGLVTNWYDDAAAWRIGTATGVAGSGYSEKLRIDSSGKVIVSSTTYTNHNSAQFLAVGDGITAPMTTLAPTTLSYTNIFFRNPNGNVGSITTNGTATSYSTSSDYRLKENVVDIADGITRVKQLQPKRFNFITDNTTTVDGFIAHEAQVVVPEAVIGTKDATKEEEYEVTPAVLNDDGEQITPAVMGTRTVPDHQGIDQSKFVPLLTAALQEAIAKIETLETQNASLEARLTALEGGAS